MYFCNPLDGGHNQVEDTKKGNHLLLCIEENKDRYLIAKDLGQKRKVRNTNCYKSGVSEVNQGITLHQERKVRGQIA